VVVSKQALEFFLKGKHDIAYELYAKAYTLDPKPEYAYGQGRADHERGQFAAAVAAYEKALVDLADGDALTLKTRTYLEKARAAQQKPNTPEPPKVEPAKPEPAKVEAPPAAPVVVQQPAEPGGGWKKPAGWTCVGVGLLGAAFGALEINSALGDRASLDERKQQKDAQGKIVGVTYEEANRIETDTNATILRGWLIVGASVGIAGAGAWMVATAPAQVALVPGPGAVGIGLAARF
jgi:tetratricopeptide (TPR) repeat protein